MDQKQVEIAVEGIQHPGLIGGGVALFNQDVPQAAHRADPAVVSPPDPVQDRFELESKSRAAEGEQFDDEDLRTDAIEKCCEDIRSLALNRRHRCLRVLGHQGREMLVHVQLGKADPFDVGGQVH